jgi:cobaltochelatase CobN
MHLLSAQAGALQQDGEAIDLNQSPAPLVFVSAADSELALLAGAADRAGTSDLRLANLLRLSHNLSVDLWIEKTVSQAKLVVVRLLGGSAYWPYGVDQLTALAASGRFQLALLPGDATPDSILQSRSTVAPDLWTQLHSLFTAGGPENADAILAAMEGRDAAEVKPFPRFGYWTPKQGVAFELPVSDKPAVPLHRDAGGAVFRNRATRALACSADDLDTEGSGMRPFREGSICGAQAAGDPQSHRLCAGARWA